MKAVAHTFATSKYLTPAGDTGDRPYLDRWIRIRVVVLVDRACRVLRMHHDST
jgi:hypothetical protein